MPTETWDRNLEFQDYPWTRVSHSPSFPTIGGTHRFWGTQRTTSWRGESSWTRFHRRKAEGLIQLIRYDFGNPFDTRKHVYRDNSRHVIYPRVGVRHYEGRLFPFSKGALQSGFLSGYPAFPGASAAELTGAGTIAIQRVSPTNPSVDLAQGLAELIRDRPQLPLRSFVRNPSVKSVAEEFLNAVFGIQPTVNDIIDTVDTVRRADELIKKFENNSGKELRRRFEFDPVTSYTKSNVAGSFVPVEAHGIVGLPGGLGRTKETFTEKRFVFSGAFTYHLDVGSDSASRLKNALQKANALYGVRFSPDLVWSLSPFSWLADWYGSIGSALTNITNAALYNQVLRYGYIQCESRTTIVYTYPSAPYLGYNLRQEFETVRKQRVRATPYGFGLNPETFSDMQWAILGALGISRGPKFLG